MIGNRSEYAARLKARISQSATAKALDIGYGKIKTDMETYHREVGRILGLEDALVLADLITSEMDKEEHIPT